MAKQRISPAQALLFLIKNASDNASQSDKLKRWYLSGIKSSDERAEFDRLLNTPELAHFEISFDPNIINQDPTRRYFETHLSHRTLEKGLQDLDKIELIRHVNSLNRQLASMSDAHQLKFMTKLKTVERVLKGECFETDDLLFQEYATYIRRVYNGEIFGELSVEDRNKIVLIAKSSLLGVVNAWFMKLPLNIYGKGIYSDDNKGKEMLHKQVTTRSRHLGIMKGYMPLAADDIALSDKEMPLLKPSDQATYRLGAQWVEDNFSQLVHPFSNSISGTMLCQLRNLAQFRRSEEGAVLVSSDKKFNKFSQLFIATMLFGSGGHTLNEFAAPLSLEAIKNEFKSLMKRPITLETMFYDDNKDAFNQALEETIHYNQQIIHRNAMLKQLHENSGFKLARNRNDFLGAVRLAMVEMRNEYSEHVRCQYLATWRIGTKKQALIMAKTTNAIMKIDAGDYTGALKIIKQLKIELENTFGKTNFANKPSQAYALVDGLEKKLIDIHSKHVISNFKQIKKIKDTSEASKQIEIERDQTTNINEKNEILIL